MKSQTKSRTCKVIRLQELLDSLLMWRVLSLSKISSIVSTASTTNSDKTIIFLCLQPLEETIYLTQESKEYKMLISFFWSESMCNTMLHYLIPELCNLSEKELQRWLSLAPLQIILSNTPIWGMILHSSMI